MSYRELIKPTLLTFILGTAIGILFSLIHYKLIEISIKNTINNHKTLLLSPLLGVAKMAALVMPLGLAVAFPKVFNIFGGAFGVIVPKFYLFVISIKKMKTRR